MADIYDFKGKKQEEEQKVTPEDAWAAALEGDPENVIIITEGKDGMLGLIFGGLSIAEVNLYLDMVKKEILNPVEE